MKILAGFILSLFLGLMFVSLFQMSGVMDMSHGMSDCPFMADQDVVCAMNLSEHIGAWKAVFTSLVPSAFTLLLSLGVAVSIATVAPHLWQRRLLYRIPIYWSQLQYKTYTYTVRPLQELFSSGILHPKLF